MLEYVQNMWKNWFFLHFKKTLFWDWNVIFSICKNLKSSVFCGENFRKTIKSIFHILGGSNKPKLSKISYFISKTELWTPENSFLLHEPFISLVSLQPQYKNAHFDIWLMHGHKNFYYCRSRMVCVYHNPTNLLSAESAGQYRTRPARWNSWNTFFSHLHLINKFQICKHKMSSLAWAVKNGDLDQVKELVDGKVTFVAWYIL